MENILQAQKSIDAVYTHDDDMAQGVVQAIRNMSHEDRCSSPASAARRTR